MAQQRTTDRARTRRRLVAGPLVALTAAAVVLGGAGTAHAAGDPDPVGNLTNQVKKAIEGGGSGSSGGSGGAKVNTVVPSRDAPNPPASDDDSPGFESPNPTAPDHSSGSINRTEVGGEPVIELGSGNATINDDDSAEASTTLLAIGGEEIIGSRADSAGPTEDMAALPEIPVCEQSMGQLCLDLLFSNSFATETPTDSDAKAENGVLNLCLGGDDPTGETCTAFFEAGLLNQESTIHRDKKTGRTTASSQNSVAEACVQRDPLLGTCALGAEVLSSQGEADSNGGADGNGSASRESQVVGLELIGMMAAVPADPSEPFAFALPPGTVEDACAGQSILCVYGNQGETYLGNQLAGTSQTALDVTLLEEVTATFGRTETLVHNDGGQTANPSRNPNRSDGKADSNARPAPAAAIDADVDNGGVLPDTGGVWSGLLALGLGLFGFGAVATAWGRRRVAL